MNVLKKICNFWLRNELGFLNFKYLFIAQAYQHYFGVHLSFSCNTALLIQALQCSGISTWWHHKYLKLFFLTLKQGGKPMPVQWNVGIIAKLHLYFTFFQLWLVRMNNNIKQFWIFLSIQEAEYGLVHFFLFFKQNIWQVKDFLFKEK